MKKKVLAVIGVLAVGAVLAGTAIASFQSDKVKASQNLNMESLSISLGVDDETTIDGGFAFPGQQLSEAMNVQNTATSDVYIRVVLQRYFTDANKEKLFSTDEVEKLDNDLISIENEDAVSNGWIVVSEDNEEVVMYYAKPVAAGDYTSDFISGVGVKKEMGNEYQGLGVALNVKTEAIQKTVAEAAMMSEWGVMATFDEDGNIIAIDE